MVAHTNKITPTAVADTLVDIFKDLEGRWQNAFDTISNIKDIRIVPQRQKLIELSQHLKLAATTPLHDGKTKVQKNISTINRLVQLKISKEQSNISLNIVPKIKYLTKNRILAEQNKLQHVDAKLQILDPKNTLKRGFSMTMINDKTVDDVNDIKKGDLITTVFHNGTVESKITKTDTHE